MSIEEHLTKLKEERDAIAADIELKQDRLKELNITIKETQKFVDKAKQALGNEKE